MSGLLNPGYINIPADITGVATIPAWTTLDGTYTADATTPTSLISDGGATPTVDFSNVIVGDYIQSGAEIREITANFWQSGNHRINIKSAFTSRPVAETPKIVKSGSLSRVTISGAGKINGQIFPSNAFPVVFENSNGLAPLIVDATGGTMTVVEQV